ncbi:MAG: hypothetical protein K2Z25_11750 [Beijerinckiaceae bacterium]|nr:hypothetical protein [Beijerinckiaceae bacterium]
MSLLTSKEIMRRCFRQIAVVRVLFLVVSMIFVVPDPSISTGFDADISGATIMRLSDSGSHSATSGTLDDELVQHAHCMHSVARTSFKTLPVRQLKLDDPLLPEADLRPSCALSSLPFKPPRSA